MFRLHVRKFHQEGFAIGFPLQQSANPAPLPAEDALCAGDVI